jgi:membrane associated rhomboid family serine protease
MFRHGSLLHLASNMIFLWVYGDNVEDAFGHVGYLLFYLFCGLAANFAQIAIDTRSTIPGIGASGAIAGVLGAYITIFPSAQIRTLLILGPFITLPRLPALLLIGFWFLTQLISGFGVLGVQEQTGGVAFWAHIGGFVVGLLVALIVRPRPTPVRRARGW